MFSKQAWKVFITKQNGFSSRNNSTIGFIGLGQMGSRMAANLLKKGQKVKVFDVVPSAVQGLSGAQICKSPQDAVKDSSIIITMLPNGKIVKDAVLGENGILKSLKSGSYLLDCSTIEPKVAQDISKVAKSRNIKFMDTPVSGGVTGAQAGTLTFMVGGDKNDFIAVEPTLLHMGAKAFHCGDIGAGLIAKLCNNLILGITMIGTAEGMNLGIKLGLDPKQLASIINISTGRSWSSDTYNPVPGIKENVPSANNYEGGFAVNLIAKDLGLAEDAALNCNAPVPLAAITHQLYRTMMNNGYATKDFSAVYEFLKGVNK